MKYIVPILLIILLGVNLYFYRSQPEILPSQKMRQDKSSKEMWTNPELSQGIEKMLQKKQQLELVANSHDRDDQDEQDLEEESDPREQLPNIDLINLQNEGKTEEIKARQKVYREDMKILVQEIQFEEQVLAQLKRSGDLKDVPMMQEKIHQKKTQLDYLRNNPPEEENYEQ